jgi:hypothetical protein
MTKIDEMDWAVAVVAAMQLPYEALRIGKDDEVAAALRKAKADGLHDAAEFVYQNRNASNSEIIGFINFAASKLHPTE